jgi:hypothetical protein
LRPGEGGGIVRKRVQTPLFEGDVGSHDGVGERWKSPEVEGRRRTRRRRREKVEQQEAVKVWIEGEGINSVCLYAWRQVGFEAWWAGSTLR